MAKHAERYLKQEGIADEMRIGPEYEFHVFDHVSYSTEPNESGFCIDTEQAEWNTKEPEFNLGYKMPHKGGYLFKDGKPLFYDANGYSQLSETALHFMGGILKHIRALWAFTNPSTNSFKRLVPGYEAPVTIGFAAANRSSAIRIPSCNGIKNKIDPVAEGYGLYDFNLYDLSDEEKEKSQSLPKTLGEALDALEADHDFLTAGGVFPQRLIEIWLKNKRAEMKKHSMMPTPIEFDMYYDL